MGFKFNMTTDLLFGAGSLDRLGKKLKKSSLSGKALLVISQGRSTRANGYLDRTIAQLEAAGMEHVLFDRIEANPLDTTVMEGAALARAEGCSFIVALGGGSVMDSAKAIAIMAANPGEVWDYIYGGHGGGQRPSQDPLPVVAITTTAGTGSEVDTWAVISNEEYGEKIAIGGSAANYPVISLVDPELMVSIPAHLTAWQGFDALFHATECYISKYANIMSDMYALESIRNIGAYLRRAVADGSDIEAREHVAFASTLSGQVMELSTCTSEHALEHAMSAMHHDLPHGAGLIMLSIEYYKWFVDHQACDDRFIAMAKALGRENATEPMEFVEALLELEQDCGVAELKMSDYGIVREEMLDMVLKAADTMSGLYNADRVPLSEAAAMGIIRRSYR